MRRSPTLLLIAAFLLPCGAAQSGGFQLFEHSARSTGTAFAEQGLEGDASTVFWNPAGMAQLAGRNLALGMHALKPSGEFSNRGSRTFLPPPNGIPLSGGTGGDPGDLNLIPNIYYVNELHAPWTLGFGLNAPFGLKTEYGDGWVGRYYALKSELRTLNINPSAAYRVNKNLAVGGGIQIQFAKAEISNAIDFSTICLAQASVMPTLGPACIASGFDIPGNAARDGRARVKGDDWAFGWNFGVLYKSSDRVRLGLAYRSRITHEIDGNATFSKPVDLPPLIAAAPAFTNGGIRSRLHLPETLAFSFLAKPSAQWVLTGNITWTRWSRVEELRIRFDNGAADAVTPFDWDDSIRIAVGTSYRLNDAWMLRAGLGYDQTPVSESLRNPRLPDADKTILGIGLSYVISKDSSVEVGYSHYFVRDANISLSTPEAGTLSGRFNEPIIDVLSIQFNRRF